MWKKYSMLLAVGLLALMALSSCKPSQPRPEAAREVLAWLESAADTLENGDILIRERYDMANKEWISIYRPDCNIESAFAFLCAWRQTGERKFLALARSVFSSIRKFQNPDGSFPFADRKDRHVYTNDNSEVPIFLMRMAEIDKEYAPEYLSVARKGTDFLRDIQNADGSWRVVDNDSSRTAMFTAHAVAALAMAAGDDSSYRTAVEKGIDFIRTQTLPSGRVRTCCEVSPGTEYWRPPSSDQSISVRGIAMAEYYLPDHPRAKDWKELRRGMLSWLNGLLDESGAIRNGLGEDINGADLPSLTDNVYTTAFGIEAYLWSWKLDANPEYKATLDGLLEFCKGNLYHSENADADGVFRGAYNLEEGNWNTSRLVLNSGNEGGSAMVYSGWANAPLASWLMQLCKSVR